MQETWVQSLDWDDPLEKEMATHSGVLAWRIPWAVVHGVANRHDWTSHTTTREKSDLVPVPGPLTVDVAWGRISASSWKRALWMEEKKKKNSCYRQGRWNCFLTQWNVNGGAPQVALVVKNSPANAGDIRNLGSIPWSGRSPGKGSGNPLQYSYLENPMDRGVWWTIVHGVTKSRTRLKQLHTHGFLRDWKVGNLWFLFNSYYNLSFEAVKVRDFCCIPVIENWGISVSDSLKIKLWGWFSKLQVEFEGVPSLREADTAGKESACNAGDLGSIPGLGRSPGEGNS